LIEQGARALRDGELLGIFPEGLDNFTRGTPPRTVGAFHSAFARVWWDVRELQVPIVPVAVVGSRRERRVPVPAAWVRALEPGSSHVEGSTVSAVFYESARIRFGPPLVPPRSTCANEAIERIVAMSREAVAALVAE
jgi:1-acyl-sn-glycerol-3-phosphate acyltransferase